MLNEPDEVRSRWAEYFNELLNVEDDREAIIGALGGEVRMPVFSESNVGEIKKGGG